MALEELRAGDESARPQLEEARERVPADARRDRRRARSPVRARTTRRRIAQALAGDPRRPEPAAATSRTWCDDVEKAQLAMSTFQIDFGEPKSSRSSASTSAPPTAWSPVMDLDRPEVIPGADGEARAERRFGDAGRARSSSATQRARLLITHPERTVYSVKRLMGRGVADVAGRAEAVPVPHCAEGSESVLQLQLGDTHVHAARDLRATFCAS